MQTQEFHLGDILSIIWCRVLSPRGIAGVYELLDFMNGEKLPTDKLSQAYVGCRLQLVVQFPQLTDDSVHSAITKLDDSLRPRHGRDMAGKILADCLAELSTEYGEMFPVQMIQGKVLPFQHPAAEAMSDRM